MKERELRDGDNAVPQIPASGGNILTAWRAISIEQLRTCPVLAFQTNLYLKFIHR
jgi:hypothetical protein